MPVLFGKRANQSSNAFSLNQTEVVLSENGEFASLTAHRRVPHVRCIDGNHQIDAVVFLQYCELCGILRIRWRNTRIGRVSTLWLKRWIELKLVAWSREEFGYALKVS